MAAKKEEVHIKAIDKAAVHRICSGQVILDLAMAVKELVENSLDAGATSIEIKLKDYGAESFEVADNGCGVSPENYQALTLKYHTSKISEFSDLQSLTSFGFRGEALSSLCALGHVSVVTRTKDEPIATELTFDHSGSIVSEKNEARPIGTTVTVSKLFAPLPVRHKEFSKNIRREYRRLLSVLHAYALVAKGVRLVCTHLTGKSRTLILKTQGTSFMRDNIITVFGTKMAACLEPLDLCLGMEFRIEGFISKPGSGSGRASTDRQFFYINGRPVELPKIAKLLNELYRSFNSQQFPMAVLNLILPTSAYDVNVTPDKRKVLLHAENSLLVALKESLEKVYAPDKYNYAVHKPESAILERESSMVRELPEFETQRCVSEFAPDITTDEVQVDICAGEVKEDTSDVVQVGNHEFLSNNDKSEISTVKVSVDVMDSAVSRPGATVKPINSTATVPDLDAFQLNASLSSASCSNASADSEMHEAVHRGTLQQKTVQSKLTGFVTSLKRQAEDDGSLLSEAPLLKRWLLPAAEDDRKDISDGYAMKGLKRCSALDVLLGSCSDNVVLNSGRNHGGQATSCYNKRDTDTDSREQISMEEETLPRDRKVSSDSPSGLHGAPSATMSDPLRPLACNTDQEITDKMTVNSPMDLESSVLGVGGATCSTALSSICFDLKKLRSRFHNGLISYKDRFGFPKQGKLPNRKRFFIASMMDGLPKEGSDKEEALAAAARELEKTFNKADFKHMKELVSLLAEEPTFDKVACGETNIESTGVDEKQKKHLCCNKSFIRPSRVRAMLASRACRSSIMIGDALSKKEMQRVLSHLAELDSPWNCPHGRPTMRHLVDLAGLKRS